MGLSCHRVLCAVNIAKVVHLHPVNTHFYIIHMCRTRNNKIGEIETSLRNLTCQEMFTDITLTVLVNTTIQQEYLKCERYLRLSCFCCIVTVCAIYRRSSRYAIYTRSPSCKLQLCILLTIMWCYSVFHVRSSEIYDTFGLLYFVDISIFSLYGIQHRCNFLSTGQTCNSLP